jgi:hypothetical protein
MKTQKFILSNLLIPASLLAVFLGSSPVKAQAPVNCETALERADDAYNRQHFREVIALLDTCASNVPVDERVRAYKLLASACVAENDILSATRALGNLLDLYPAFEPDSTRERWEVVTLVQTIKTRREEEKRTRMLELKKTGRKKWLLLGSVAMIGGSGVAAYLLLKSKEQRLPDPPALPESR